MRAMRAVAQVASGKAEEDAGAGGDARPLLRIRTELLLDLRPRLLEHLELRPRLRQRRFELDRGCIQARRLHLETARDGKLVACRKYTSVGLHRCLLRYLKTARQVPRRAVTLPVSHSPMRPVFRYLLAVLLAAAAALAQTSYETLFGNRPFFLFFCAVFASAIFCGLGGSLLTILLASLFVLRYGAFQTRPAAIAQTVVFAALGVALTAALSKRRDDELRGVRATSESMRVLNEVSEVLASSLDYEETIPAAVRLALGILGDWCTVSFVDDEGQARRIAVVHRDPAKDPLAQRMMTEFPPRRDLPRPVTDSISLQKPTILNALDEQFLTRASSGPEHAALVRELGFGSMLVAPLVARGRTIGALTFLAAKQGRYTDDDASIGELIARRAAIAIDNAQLYRAAVEASNAKDEFLATVSHELRTPMTATLGWVRMLNLGHFDEETRKTALEAIERSTHAQAMLIDDILDVSSITLGKFRLESVPVELTAVVNAAIETLRPALAAKAMTLDLDTSRWQGVIAGDPNRLQQVVWNLVSNAIKFGRREG